MEEKLKYSLDEVLELIEQSKRRTPKAVPASWFFPKQEE